MPKDERSFPRYHLGCSFDRAKLPLFRNPTIPTPITQGLRMSLLGAWPLRTSAPECILYIRRHLLAPTAESLMPGFARAARAGYFSLHHSFVWHYNKSGLACQQVFPSKTVVGLYALLRCQTARQRGNNRAAGQGLRYILDKAQYFDNLFV